MNIWTGEEPSLHEVDILYPYPPEIEERPDLIHPFID